MGDILLGRCAECIREGYNPRVSNAASFLQGGGELGALIPRQGLVADAARRARDLAAEPEDRARHRPQLPLPHVRVLGPELIKIYNDGYRPITGHKHPWALGRPAREVLAEIWSDIEPLVARALAGDPTWSDDLMPVHGAERVPRGGLLHLLVQPGA
jgi:hypothetical protein